MTRSDRIVALIRTAVPAAVGYLLAKLIAVIPAVGGVLDALDRQLAQSGIGGTVSRLLEIVATAGVVAAYYWLARVVGARWPRVERWLLGSARTPVYDAASEDEILARLAPLTDTEREADIQAARERSGR